MAGAYVGITDGDWFESLRALPSPEEVNFWQPSAHGAFRALSPGGLFLFKLHSPLDFIVGGGLFAHYSRLPVSMAWQVFAEKNGAASIGEMRGRIEKYRRGRDPREDYEIGCILLEEPFFFSRDMWIPVSGWQKNIVRGRGYDLATEPGLSLLREVRERLGSRPLASVGGEDAERYLVPAARYAEALVRVRLGQASFRVVVTDAYARRCAVTGERVLPVLEAAHIRPFAEGGEHLVRNGLLLRSDLHTLFDRGYVTVTPELDVEVSRRLKDHFNNGEEYLRWHGRRIATPKDPADHPARDLLAWHNENKFVA